MESLANNIDETLKTNIFNKFKRKFIKNDEITKGYSYNSIKFSIAKRRR